MSRPPEGPKLRPNPKRGGTFYIYWTDAETGRSRERSTGTRDLAEAHTAFASWLGSRGAAPWSGPCRAADAKIADVLAIYAQEHAAEHTASPETVGYAIKALLGWWGERTCDFVKPETCRAYVKARTGAGGLDCLPPPHADSQNGGRLPNAHSRPRSVAASTYGEVAEWIIAGVATQPRILETPGFAGSNPALSSPETCRAYVKARAGQDHSPGGISVTLPTRAGGSISRPVAESTAGRELTVLRAALGYAHKNGKLLDRPFVELPPRPPGRDRWLTRDEAAALLRQSRHDPQARGHLPLFILLALTTGARPGALFDLRWTQIDFDRDRIDFNPPGRKRTSKGRPIISIPRRLRWFLLRAHARASSPYVLAFQGKKLGSVKKSFRRARARAGLGTDVIPYTLRHSAGTWLAQAGVDLYIIAGWLGHTNERTTQLYAHHHPAYLEKARKVMD